MTRAALLTLLCLSVTALAQEVPDNAVDEDGDGWLGTSAGFSLRATHPRIVTSAAGLTKVLARMVGPNARAPYSRWYQLLKTAEDSNNHVNLTSLALLYKATNDVTYLNRFIARVPATGAPGLDELSGIDLLFDQLPSGTLTSVMQRAADANGFYYSSLAQSQTSNYATVGWGYHSAAGAATALAYAGIFALTPLELTKNTATAPFDALNFVKLARFELSPGGPFYNIERRIAGDPMYNAAVPGSPGGMYDNFGYDQGEESNSITLVAVLDTLIGSTLANGLLHDRYRATFYQNMQYPFLVSRATADSWCRHAGSEQHMLARIWNTQTDYKTQPTLAVLAASVYQDRRMQYFVANGTDHALCGAPYNGLEQDLLFYDDALTVDPPSTNPTAMYFNGPGLVSTRSDWTDNASFAVFMAGDGISRRYEDANSFLLGRKSHIVVNAGARVRGTIDNENFHWYAIRAASKNTLKIFDPQESFDILSTGAVGALHSGTPLVASDNLGGMLFETQLSNRSGCFPAPDGVANPGSGSCTRNIPRGTSAFPLGVYDVANVIRYEHVDNAYTYAVGDGAPAYTRKIDLFQREFVHLRALESFVIFDRVRSADASFRKVWTIHTVDEPVVSGTPIITSLGRRTYQDARSVTLRNQKNVTTLSLLAPIENRTTVRGGDSTLARAPLRSGTPIAATAITPSDIPRWVEVLAAGSDANGTLHLQGDAREGTNITEDVVMTGTTRQNSLDSVPTSVTTTLTDTQQAWVPNQWAGFMVEVSCSNGAQLVRITGNTATTLSGAFSACSAWRYTIFRFLANTRNHWSRITSVTTSDLDFDELVLSVPHYYDAEDATGNVWSFAPNTDSKADSYTRRTDFGQWTLEVEARLPQRLDGFLNVFTLRDPGATAPPALEFHGPLVKGLLLADTAVVFAIDSSPLDTFEFTLPPATAAVHVLLFDLGTQTTYGCNRVDQLITCGRSVSGITGQSTTMGVLQLDLPGAASDGGVTQPDAGADAGQTVDAGHVETDAGSGEIDAGRVEIDAGSVEIDAGLPASDAGQPVDGGSGQAVVGGCGCRSGGQALLGVALLALARRRPRTRR